MRARIYSGEHIRYLLYIFISAAVGLGSFLLASCNITDPPAYVNKQAHSPVIDQYAIHGVRPGQILTGNVTITIDSLPAALKVWRVELYVHDTLRSGSFGPPPYVLSFDSRKLPEGQDTLVINILLAQDSTLGLLNGLITTGPNDIGFSTKIPVTVMNNFPAGPQNFNCVWTDYPLLSWSASQDPDFHAYILRRFWPGTMIDTIFDRNTTSFNDASIPPVYGTSVGYSLSIWNGYSESGRDSVYVVRGTMLSKPGDGVFMAASPVRDELYLQTFNTTSQTAQPLWAFSTITNTVIDSLPTAVSGIHLNLSSDGSIISYFDLDLHAIRRLMVSGFSFLPDITINSYGDQPTAIAVGRDRIVITTEYGDLDMFDAASGKLLDVVGHFLSSNSLPSMISAPNSDTIFVALGQDLYEVNAGLDTLDVIYHRVYSQPISGLAIVPGTGLLAVQEYNYVDLDQISGLATQTTLAYQSQQVLAMCFAGSKGYLATPDPAGGNGGTPEGVVSEFNIGNVVPVRNWTFETSSNMKIAVSRDDSTLYVTNYAFGPEFQGNRTFVVKLK